MSRFIPNGFHVFESLTYWHISWVCYVLGWEHVGHPCLRCHMLVFMCSSYRLVWIEFGWMFRHDDDIFRLIYLPRFWRILLLVELHWWNTPLTLRWKLAIGGTPLKRWSGLIDCFIPWWRPVCWNMFYITSLWKLCKDIWLLFLKKGVLVVFVFFFACVHK